MKSSSLGTMPSGEVTMTSCTRVSCCAVWMADENALCDFDM